MRQFILSLCFLFSSAVYADTADLDITVGAHEIKVVLKTMPVNLFGFNHQASTEAERSIVKQTMDRLLNEDYWFFDPAAGCMMDGIEVEASVFAKSQHSHGDHDHSHDHEQDHSHGHEDVLPAEVVWYYLCDDMRAVTLIQIVFLQAYPGHFKSLMIRWRNGERSGAARFRQDGSLNLFE